MNLSAAELAQFLGERLDRYCYTYQSSIILALKRFIVRYSDLELDEEWAYHSFIQPEAGRPFQADALVRNRKTGRIVCVIEIKNLYQQSVNLKNYLYDVIRLGGVDFDYPVQRLLIIAGAQENAKYLWDGANNRRQTNAGILQSILPMQIGIPNTVNLKKTYPKLLGFAPVFSRTLGISLPVRLQTEMVADYASSRSHISIWKVKRVGRQELLPSSA